MRRRAPIANVNAPIRDAFDCSLPKPMRRHLVLRFPRALLSFSQEKSSGVEIDHNRDLTQGQHVLYLELTIIVNC